MTRTKINFLFFLMITCSGFLFESCVYDYPEYEWIPQSITLNIKTDADWLSDIEIPYTKSGSENIGFQYTIKIYPSGSQTKPVKELTIYQEGLNNNEISTSLNLTPGNYDVRVWADVCDMSDHKSLFYDDSDFAAITYLSPYQGNTNLKDAFIGFATLTIPESCEQENIRKDITLSRPLARFKFISTDVDAFIEKQVKEGKIPTSSENLASSDNLASQYQPFYDELSLYSVRVIYPLYIPSAFNIFQDKPVNSLTGISFIGNVSVLNSEEALLGFDYVMTGNNSTSVQLALEIYDAQNKLVSSIGTLNIPIEKNHTTIVYGNFLTTLRNDGVSVNPDFEGEYNIEIK